MKKLIVFFIPLIFLTGCFHHFDKSNLSGISGYKTNLVLTPNNDIFEHIKNKIVNNESRNHLIKECGDNSNFMPAAVIPIVVGAAKLGFDLYLDKKNLELEELEKAAQRTYSGQVTIKSSELVNSKCAILIRYKDKTEKPTIKFIAIVKILKYDTSGFRIQPIYVMANDAVAYTENMPNNGTPTMKVSIGFSVKAIGNQESGLKGLFPVGQSAVSITEEISLGKKKEYVCYSDCYTSDLIPFPGIESSLTSVSMSITETGNVGIDFDQRKAELKAIKETIGPTLTESLTEALK